MPKVIRITVTISKDIHDRLSKEAKAQERTLREPVSISRVVRQWIDTHAKVLIESRATGRPILPAKARRT